MMMKTMKTTSNNNKKSKIISSSLTMMILLFFAGLAVMTMPTAFAQNNRQGRINRLLRNIGFAKTPATNSRALARALNIAVGNNFGLVNDVIRFTRRSDRTCQPTGNRVVFLALPGANKNRRALNGILRRTIYGRANFARAFARSRVAIRVPQDSNRVVFQFDFIRRYRNEWDYTGGRGCRA